MADDDAGASRHNPPEDASGSDPGPDSAADDKPEAGPATPVADVPEAPPEQLDDKLSSPKKKRAHDQVGEAVESNDATSVSSTDSGRDRASRLEPEKKRTRDEESGDTASNPPESDAPSTAPKDEAADRPPGDKAPAAPPITFETSGFGQLAQAPSAFAALGASRGSAFSSFKPAPSSSASSSCPSGLAPVLAATAPKLTFGSNGGASPFAGLSPGTNGFGGKMSASFGSAVLGPKPVSCFAASGGKALEGGKAARPFGAPDSDSDDGDEDADEERDNDSQSDEEQRSPSPEKDPDDKKRTKHHKVEVDDGEAGEATIASVRAKMFSLDKEAGWKERGAGMLKINVPRSCVVLDETGVPIPGKFDASGLGADQEAGDDAKGHRVARLIMRQDQTHRVILNTVIVPAMHFQEKTSLKSVGILFTAFEGEQAKPVSVTMRMSAANARSFMGQMDMVQRELRAR